MNAEQKEDPAWKDAQTLEVWTEQMLREGRTEIVKTMIQFMREEVKPKYREIWNRVMKEKQKK